MPKGERIMTQHVLHLAEKAASYKRGGDHLLQAIKQVDEVLTTVFGEYTQFRFIQDSVAYLANLASSNVGNYGEALCYVQDHGEGHQRFKPMPPCWSEAGSGFYLHNDLHCWIDCATRVEVVKVAKNLPAFLKALAEFLEEKGALNDKSAIEIQKIADNLRNATS